MNKARTAITLAVPLVIALSSDCVLAQVLKNHQNATDPTTEGWSGPAAGPIGTGGLLGPYLDTLPSWQIVDPVDAAPNYTVSLLPYLGGTSNWNMVAKLRIQDQSRQLEYGVSFFVDDGTSFWALSLWHGGTNNGPIFIAGLVPSGIYAINDGGTVSNVALMDVTNAFHTYEMRMDRHGAGTADDTADVFVDGVFVKAMPRSMVASSFAPGLVGWGTAGTFPVDTANWNQVYLEVPEPAPVLLTSLGTLVLFLRRRTEK